MSGSYSPCRAKGWASRTNARSMQFRKTMSPGSPLYPLLSPCRMTSSSATVRRKTTSLTFSRKLLKRASAKPACKWSPPGPRGAPPGIHPGIPRPDRKPILINPLRPNESTRASTSAIFHPSTRLPRSRPSPAWPHRSCDGPNSGRTGDCHVDEKPFAWATWSSMAAKRCTGIRPANPI